MIYNLNVELEADNLEQALQRIAELPTDFEPADFASWLRAYNLYGPDANVAYVNRLDVTIPTDEPERPEVLLEV